MSITLLFKAPYDTLYNPFNFFFSVCPSLLTTFITSSTPLLVFFFSSILLFLYITQVT